MLEKHLTRPQLFRYSAITWNPHRVHYDPEHARNEGHTDVLVQAHLHGAVLQELVMSWAGANGRLTDLAWKNVAPATPDEVLHVGGQVTEVDASSNRIDLQVWTRTSRDHCVEGTASIVLE